MAATVRAVNLVVEETPFEEVMPLGRVLSLADLEALPAPEPMIEGVLGHRSAVLMVGASQSNKTFAAVGMGLSVATGKPWLDHKVLVKGHVVFVIGEGLHGLAGRVAAWKEHHKTDVLPRKVSFVSKPMSINHEAFWQELTTHCLERQAKLVILDTLSSLAPGIDETKESAAIMRFMSDLSATIDGTVILVHHTGWGPQNRARGGSQFESNADEVIVFQKPEGGDDKNPPVEFKRKKTKEAEAGYSFHVKRLLVGTSAVLTVVKDGEQRTDKAAKTRASVEAEILRNLEANPYLFTKTDMREEVKGKGDIFNEVWESLVVREWIVSVTERKEDDRRAAMYWAVKPIDDMA